eukprot:2880642-Ditylum_brightwellii.AAC.1
MDSKDSLPDWNFSAFDEGGYSNETADYKEFEHFDSDEVTDDNKSEHLDSDQHAGFGREATGWE